MIIYDECLKCPFFVKDSAGKCTASNYERRDCNFSEEIQYQLREVMWSFWVEDVMSGLGISISLQNWFIITRQ